MTSSRKICVILSKAKYLKKRMMNKHYVYILTNKNKTVLYTGVTNDLTRRLIEHIDNIEQGKKTFAAKYRCKHLLYYEQYDWIQEAIAREKEIKGWVRAKKVNLIKSINLRLGFFRRRISFYMNFHVVRCEVSQ